MESSRFLVLKGMPMLVNCWVLILLKDYVLIVCLETRRAFLESTPLPHQPEEAGRWGDSMAVGCAVSEAVSACYHFFRAVSRFSIVRQKQG